MRIVIVDDEERAKNVLSIMLRGMGQEDIVSFSAAEEALEYIRHRGCDLAFLDIEMPGMDGLAMAEELLKLPGLPVTVFVTAFPQYALQAWDVEAVDYVLKPFSREQLQRALERAERRIQSTVDGEKRVEVRCFPTFEVWLNGAPLTFGNEKAKELLAYLVHMQGAWVTIDRIAYALFEDSDEKSAKNYYRLVLYRLKSALREVGLEHMIESGYGKARVDSSAFCCDYYRYLNGETQLFFGEYLTDYTWAEQTLADLRAKM